MTWPCWELRLSLIIAGEEVQGAHLPDYVGLIIMYCTVLYCTNLPDYVGLTRSGNFHTFFYFDCFPWLGPRTIPTQVLSVQLGICWYSTGVLNPATVRNLMNIINNCQYLWIMSKSVSPKTNRNNLCMQFSNYASQLITESLLNQPKSINNFTLLLCCKEQFS